VRYPANSDESGRASRQGRNVGRKTFLLSLPPSSLSLPPPPLSVWNRIREREQVTGDIFSANITSLTGRLPDSSELAGHLAILTRQKYNKGIRVNICCPEAAVSFEK
jgi:hypothetical protein